IPAQPDSRPDGGHHLVPPSVLLAAAAVRPREKFEEVTVGIFEVHAAAAVPVIDHARPGPAWISPVLQALALDPVKGSVEVVLTNQEGVVLRRDRTRSLREIQRDVVVGLDHEEMREPGWRRQAQDPG